MADSNACAGIGTFFLFFWGIICAVILGTLNRAAYRGGYADGRAAAAQTFARIIDAANARELFADVPEFQEYENETAVSNFMAEPW